MQSLSRLIIFLWAISLGAVCYLSLTPRIEFPADFWKADLVYHFLAYSWLSVLPFFGFQRPKPALMSAILMVPLGVSLEFAQIWVPGRLFSAADLGANIFGAFCGAVCGKYLRSIFTGSSEIEN
jgi:hypothetical protein